MPIRVVSTLDMRISEDVRLGISKSINRGLSLLNCTISITVFFSYVSEIEISELFPPRRLLIAHLTCFLDVSKSIVSEESCS